MRRTFARMQKTLNFVPMQSDQVEFLQALEKIVQSVSKRLLPLITADLTENGQSSERGREGMSAGQVLRLAMIKQIYRLSYRDLQNRVEDSILLRKFAGYEYTMVPAFKTLQANIKQVREETWMMFNQALVRYGVAHQVDSHESLRIDTTAVESNIHHPTDASLLWDTVRVLVRILKHAKEVFPQAGISLHNRSKKTKKLLFQASNEKSKEKRDALILEMACLATETCRYATHSIKALKKHPVSEDISLAAKAVAETLKEYKKLGEQVIKQARIRIKTSKSVAAGDKVVSLFEPHTDVIVKGSRETVFGHKVSLTVGAKLIQDCQVLDGNPADNTTFIDALESFKSTYRCLPKAVAVDGGYASEDNARRATEEMKIERVCMTRGAGVAARAWLVEGEGKRLLQRFRAGVEGVISGVKRSVSLRRVRWRGYEGFCTYVVTVHGF